jgi:hypothetical protein
MVCGGAEGGLRMTDETTIQQALASLLKAIEERRAEDPLIGAKIAGKQILTNVLGGMKTERGVHVESFLTALGAIAGFACQMGLRAEAEAKGEKPALVIVKGADGRVFYFGDPLNARVAESRYSVWSLCAGMAQHLGGEILDVNEIFAHVVRTVGSSDFGKPRFPGAGSAGDLPANYVRMIWPMARRILGDLRIDPSEWHIGAGLAGQQAIEMTKDTIDPGEALKIVMESAIPMSKLDPREVGIAIPAGAP